MRFVIKLREKMQTGRFYAFLLLTSVVAFATAQGVAHWRGLDARDQQFMHWSLFFFVLLNVGMYHLGRKAANSSNKFLFSQVGMFFTVSKLLLGMTLVLVFWKVRHPHSKEFILPFFAMYLIFVLFETYFMVRVARK